MSWSPYELEFLRHVARIQSSLAEKSAPAHDPPSGEHTMKTYSDPAEKILDQQENATIITNPDERVGTFWRKLKFRLARLTNWLNRHDRESTDSPADPSSRH
jgi:hypothetical protein